MNRKLVWCEKRILETAVNINDDGRHLSKQRQVSFLIYGNFDRFEIPFFAMIVFAWRYARSYIQCNCANLQRIDQTGKKIFWECLSDSVRSRITLDADTYENGFHKIKNITQNDVQCYNIDMIFSNFLL